MAVRKSKTGTRDVGSFPLDTALSKPARIAAFLDWWAQRHPYNFAAYNEILKAVEGYSRLPRMDTEEVEAIRACTGRAEKLLHGKYKRALIRHRGLGARASVDDADVIRHKQSDRAKKVERSIVALARQDEIIDTRRVPDTAENRALKQWYQRDVKSILRQVASPEFLAKMLPPGTKKPEAEE